MVAPQRLADPLAVRVAAAALVAAHPLVVQHWVDVHGVLLALQASLSGDTHTHTHSSEVTALCTIKIITGFLAQEPRSTRQEGGLGSVCVHIIGSLESGLRSLPGPLQL